MAPVSLQGYNRPPCTFHLSASLSSPLRSVSSPLIAKTEREREREREREGRRQSKKIEQVLIGFKQVFPS